MLDQFADQDLQCSDCGGTFVFTQEEQEFYSTKGFSAPKRCSHCRAARKSHRGFGGGGGGGGKPKYDVVCSACGCETTVPFEPRGDRPVYCSDCYRNQ